MASSCQVVGWKRVVGSRTAVPDGGFEVIGALVGVSSGTGLGAFQRNGKWLGHVATGTMANLLYRFLRIKNKVLQPYHETGKGHRVVIGSVPFVPQMRNGFVRVIAHPVRDECCLGFVATIYQFGTRSRPSKGGRRRRTAFVVVVGDALNGFSPMNGIRLLAGGFHPIVGMSDSHDGQDGIQNHGLVQRVGDGVSVSVLGGGVFAPWYLKGPSVIVETFGTVGKDTIGLQQPRQEIGTTVKHASRTNNDLIESMTVLPTKTSALVQSPHNGFWSVLIHHR